jgi:hypothetical protein
MEVLIPAVALGGLYAISQQSHNPPKSQSIPKTREAFGENPYPNRMKLPNTDVPDRNYPPNQSYNGETDKSSLLSTVNKNAPPHRAYTDKYFDPQRNYLIQQSAQFAQQTGKQYTSLEGTNVDLTHFVHSNMAPFFGSKTHSNHQTFNSNESILDNYVGSGSVSYAKNKQEIAPMFKPSAGNQWTHGMPNMNDFMQTRVNPSMNRNGERPGEMEPIRVAPGLGLGYTNEGVMGFNSGLGMREAWKDKTVDELRVATNPKASDGRAWGHEGPAMSRVTVPGILGDQQKNGPSTTFETGSERWMTTTGLAVGPSNRSVQMDRETARQNQSSFAYEGVAAGYARPAKVGEFMDSTRHELGALPIGVSSAIGKYSPTASDFEARSMSTYANNRSIGGEDATYFGAIGGAIGAAVAPLLDVLRPSRKENTVGNLRPYENAKPTNTSKSYLFDPTDRPANTVRELTEHGTGAMFVNRSQIQGGDAYLTTNHELRPEQRDTTSDFYYAGISSAGARNQAARRVDTEYYGQHNNDAKDSVVSNSGFMPSGKMDGYYSELGEVQPTAKDVFIRNQRPLSKTDGPRYMPSVDMMGQVQERQTQRLDLNLERTEGDLLSAYRSNPYTQFVNNKNQSIPSMI